MRISLIAAALIALPLLAACGSSDHKDPQPTITQADLSKSMQSGGLDPKVADCAAKIYVEEGISQDGLRLMSKPGTNTQSPDPGTMGLSKDDAAKAKSAVQKFVQQCTGTQQ
ncbi:hypothetical protein [Nocardia terpenica]|uniref:DUF732 domain-containing protein n=1 Tax=Nocardia terpenica TaxID=455432 RepID=A0A291RVB8_9NOCA|nr:hypothetical protein [Nocardia terpenica]ATL71174.1 hypothetical protein CRH09_38385 [Nocardia terpenica]